MRELRLVGIGMGSPGHLTLEGREALRTAEIVLLPRKGEEKAALAALRLSLLEAAGSRARVVPFDMPVRDPTLPYAERVERWHDAIAARWAHAIALAAPTGPVALMVWGDPGLYDSTLRIAARLDPRPCLRVVPGITALQALTAAHAIPFNTVGGAVVVTTGRRLRTLGWPPGAETVAVMLDSGGAWSALDPAGLSIWWGACLGLPQQVLLSGPLASVGPAILDARARLRAAHGWVMDVYLLRRAGETPGRGAPALATPG